MLFLPHPLRFDWLDQKTSATLIRSIARGLNLDEKTFDEAFEGGISTLRFIHYPVRPEQSFEGAIGEDL